MYGRARKYQVFIKVFRLVRYHESRKNSLAHMLGAGSDHHVPAMPILTDLSKEVLRKGKIKNIQPEKSALSHRQVVSPLEAGDCYLTVLKAPKTRAA